MILVGVCCFFFFKQKTAYEMRISDWSSDVCSSDLTPASTAALLLNLEGLATLAIAWLVYRENVDLRVGIGAAAILLGAIILSWQTGVGQADRKSTRLNSSH